MFPRSVVLPILANKSKLRHQLKSYEVLQADYMLRETQTRFKLKSAPNDQVFRLPSVRELPLPPR
jgi:hypothetical protein